MNTVNALYLKAQPILLAVLFLLFLPNFLFSQNLVRHLRSPEVSTAMLKVDSIRLNKYGLEKSLVAPIADEEEELTIPIIFHIVYSNASEQVDKSEITNQLAVLNTAFSGQSGNNFTHLSENKEGYGMFKATDSAIRFCIANRADAINYVSSSVGEWGADFGLLTSVDGVQVIEPDKYLNVVIAPLADSVSGYSGLPWFPKSLDAVIIDYRYFGTVASSYPYNEGKTLIHLIANSLAVNSLWTNGKCEDDKIIDTPIHNAPNRGCPTYLHVSTCYDNAVELTYNYLDNTDDRCLNSFTKGQVERMRKVLKVLRKDWIANPVASVCGDAALVQAESADSRSSTTVNLANKTPELTIRPNPANGRVEILLKESKDLPSQEIAIRIFSASGKALYDNVFSPDGVLSIDSSNWSAGLYFVKSKIGDVIQTNTLVIAR